MKMRYKLKWLASVLVLCMLCICTILQYGHISRDLPQLPSSQANLLEPQQAIEKGGLGNAQTTKARLPAGITSLQQLANSGYVDNRYGLLNEEKLSTDGIFTEQQAKAINVKIREAFTLLSTSERETAKIEKISDDNDGSLTEVTLPSNSDILNEISKGISEQLNTFCSSETAKLFAASIMGTSAFYKFGGTHTAEVLEEGDTLIVRISGSLASKISTKKSRIGITTTIPPTPSGPENIGATNKATFYRNRAPELFNARWGYLIPQ